MHAAVIANHPVTAHHAAWCSVKQALQGPVHLSLPAWLHSVQNRQQGNPWHTYCQTPAVMLQVWEFEQMMTHMQPVFKPLLKPHLEDLEKKVAPGLFILTWASMNIDGYLHRFKQVSAAHARWHAMAQ